jgi:hypothetical protein
MRARDRIRSAIGRLTQLLEAGRTNVPPERPDTLRDVLRGLRLDLHETARPVLLCFACDKLTAVADPATVVRDALLDAPPTCTTCGASLNVWKNTLLAMSTDAGLALATQVGARHTAILYPLAVGEIASFDVRDRGVPQDATILRIVHRAAHADGIAVLDLDGADSARAPNFVVRVLAVPVGASHASDLQAQTTVTWAHHDADDDGRRSLNRALVAIADGRPEEAIVPANVC